MKPVRIYYPENLDDMLVMMDENQNAETLGLIESSDDFIDEDVVVQIALQTSLTHVITRIANASPLKAWFADLGITEDHNVSMIVVRSWCRRHNGVEVDLEGQIAKILNHHSAVSKSKSEV